MSSFDPKPHLIPMAKGKDGKPKMYLPTPARILWFRTNNPKGSIVTEQTQFAPFPIFRAVVTDADGILLGTGHGSAQPKSGVVYAGREVEKAETAAIGRALGLAGYGTQFDSDEDDDSDHLADSPQERRPAAPGLTEGYWKQFTAEWTAAAYRDWGWTLKYEHICEALNVRDVKEWKGSGDEADARMTAWLDAKEMASQMEAAAS